MGVITMARVFPTRLRVQDTAGEVVSITEVDIEGIEEGDTNVIEVNCGDIMKWQMDHTTALFLAVEILKQVRSSCLRKNYNIHEIVAALKQAILDVQ
jgi:hypothetical protein